MRASSALHAILVSSMANSSMECQLNSSSSVKCVNQMLPAPALAALFIAMLLVSMLLSRPGCSQHLHESKDNMHTSALTCSHRRSYPDSMQLALSF